MKTVYHPRNDFVVIRIVERGQTPGGVLTPEQSVEGKHFFVEAIGPKVEGLKIDDRVVLLGEKGRDGKPANFFPLPNASNLIAIQEEFVALVAEDVE